MVHATARPALALSLTASILAGCGGGNVPAPTSFANHSVEGFFSCEYPEGWDKESKAPQGASFGWARFSKGNALIKIETSVGASAIGDIAKATSFGGEPDEDSAPVAEAHEFRAIAFKEEFPEAKEGQEKTIQAAGGPCRINEFQAPGGMGGKIHGVRATLLSSRHAIQVVCTCPAGNWKVLKPAFERVVKSVRP